MKRNLHYVYWYHLDTHSDPYTEGYIGVTNWLSRRDYQHRSCPGKGSFHLHNAFNKYGHRIKRLILLETHDREHALLEELYWRPIANIGWNITPGGGSTPDCTGRVHTHKIRQRISESNKKTRANKPKQVSKFKGQINRWSEEQKAKIGKAHKGKTISEKHRQAISNKLSGINSPSAKSINLVSINNPSCIHSYDCIKTASDELNLGYQGLRSLYQRSQNDNESKGPNRKGWIVLHDSDLNNPIETVSARINFQKQSKKNAIALREKRRAAKVLANDQD